MNAADRARRDAQIEALLVQGKTFREVAQLLEIPPGSVATTARRIGFEGDSKAFDSRLLRACRLIDEGLTDSAVSRDTRVSLKTVKDLRKELGDMESEEPKQV